MTVTSSRSPSTRWTHQHGQKRKHATPELAQNHADELNTAKLIKGAKPWGIYPCQWPDHYKYGETADEHWHVGRDGALTRKPHHA